MCGPVYACACVSVYASVCMNMYVCMHVSRFVCAHVCSLKYTDEKKIREKHAQKH